MANTLNRMERDGLVIRTPDAGDRRRTLVHLTPKALGLEAELVDCACEVNRAATAGLSDTEIATLLSTMQRIIANLERADLNGNAQE
jgi:DNA-binding MarR family transcriptional regulator